MAAGRLRSSPSRPRRRECCSARTCRPGTSRSACTPRLRPTTTRASAASGAPRTSRRAANGNSGQNWDRINDPTNLDPPWLDADTNLSDSARIADAQKGQSVLADLVPAIPLDPFPDIVIVNSDKIGVAGGGTFQHNFAYGPFTYMNTWYAK